MTRADAPWRDDPDLDPVAPAPGAVRRGGAPLTFNEDDESDPAVEHQLWRPRVAPRPDELSWDDELALREARAEEQPPAADVPANLAEFRDHIGLGLRRQAFSGLQFEGGRYVGGRAEAPPSGLGSIVKSLTPSPPAPIPEPDLHERNTWTYAQADGTAGDWRPRSVPAHKPLREAMFRIRHGVRVLARPRVAACGYAPAAGAIDAGAVAVVANAEGRARWCGVQHCGSLWECATCALTINARRGDQLQALVAKHGGERCGMISLTIRHGAGDDLRDLRDRLGRAWTKLANGSPWARFKASLGISGNIRALETTHGPNGWHPHLHVVFVLERDAERAEDGTWNLGTVEHGRGKRRHTVDLRAWLVSRWQTVVRELLGEAHVPDDTHGVVATLLHDASYLTKLGLELADPGLKEGRGDNRTPWQIAHDYVERVRALRKLRVIDIAGDEQASRDKHLWRTYCRAMLHARKLVWSNGLLDRFGLRDIPDEHLAEDEQPAATETVLVKVPLIAWNVLRGLRRCDAPASHWILEQAEAHGGAAARRAVLECVAEAQDDRAREALAALEAFERAELTHLELLELRRGGGVPRVPTPDPDTVRREAHFDRLMAQARR